jgi:hypothetical protein
VRKTPTSSPTAGAILAALVLGLATPLPGCTGDKGTMTNSAGVVGVAALMQAARAQSAKAFPIETFESYPIPVREHGKLLVLFLYGSQHARPGAIELTVPAHVARFDAATARLVSIERFAPKRHGLDLTPGDPIGAHTLRPGVSADDYRAQRDVLLRDYDLLLPAFARDERNPSNETRAAAAEFRSLFPQLAQAPILPMYRAVGAEFFTWIDSVAR